jgi:hypothetical protein
MPTVDIYQNFVGAWEGTDRYFKDGVEIIEALRVEIQETKKKDALKCVYIYGKKGQPGFERTSRRITLHPVKSIMTSEWKNAAPENYRATGLDGFAAKGLGTFTVSTTVPEGDKKNTYVGVFSLYPDRFFYRWEKSEDGKAFVPSGIIDLNRVSPPTSPTPSGLPSTK